MSQEKESVKDKAVVEIKKSVEGSIKQQKQRKTLIFAAMAVVILVLAVIIILSLLPTFLDHCVNGVQDGDELNIDCGGSCGECDDGRVFLLRPFSIVGVDVADDGTIYVVDQEMHRVLFYDKNLEYLGNIGLKDDISGGLGDYQFIEPISVAVAPNGNILVLDKRNARIQVYNSNRVFVSSIRENLTDNGGDISADMDNSIWFFGGKSTFYVFNPDFSFRQNLGSFGKEKGQINFAKGVTIDSEGRKYVANTGNHRVDIFTPDFKHITSIGGERGTGNDQFDGPADVAVSPDGKIFVLDAGNNRVQVFNSSLKYLGTIAGKRGEGNDELYDPRKIAVGNDGKLYVADAGNVRLQIFNPDFSYSDTIQGVQAAILAEFDPRYVAVNSEGHIYVTDSDSSRVLILNEDGEILDILGGEKGFGSNQFNDPRGIALDNSGRVYVVDTGNYRVQVYDSEGKNVATIGGKKGDGINEFNEPRDVLVDKQGRIFVSEKVNARVQVFGPDFQYLSSLNYDFVKTYGLGIDGAGNIYVIDVESDYNNKIQVFGSDLQYVEEIDAPKDFEKAEGSLAITSDGKIIMPDMELGKIGAYDIASKSWQNIGRYGNGEIEFSYPNGMAIGPDGKIYVGDRGNHRIQILNPDFSYYDSIYVAG